MKYSVAVPLLLFASASHAEIILENWVFNIDGTVSDAFFGDPLPTDGTLVDGLGTLSLQLTGDGSLGNRNVLAMFDFEIDRELNTYFNEYGKVTGAPQSGQSWEIDEPGFVFGDIYDNVLNGTLDNTIGVTEGSEDDVSFAMGWNFSLLDGDVATIEYVFSDQIPTVDFFLTQVDPDSNQSIFFYSSLNIESSGSAAGPNVPPIAEVPEPGTWSLYLLGLLGVARIGKRVAAKTGRTAALPA